MTPQKCSDVDIALGILMVLHLVMIADCIAVGLKVIQLELWNALFISASFMVIVFCDVQIWAWELERKKTGINQ